MSIDNSGVIYTYILFANYGQGWEIHQAHNPWDDNPNWRRVKINVPDDLIRPVIECEVAPAPSLPREDA